MCTHAGTGFSPLLCKTCPNEEFSDMLSEYIMFFRENRHQTDSAVAGLNYSGVDSNWSLLLCLFTLIIRSTLSSMYHFEYILKYTHYILQCQWIWVRYCTQMHLKAGITRSHSGCCYGKIMRIFLSKSPSTQKFVLLTVASQVQSMSSNVALSSAHCIFSASWMCVISLLGSRFISGSLLTVSSCSTCGLMLLFVRLL